LTCPDFRQRFRRLLGIAFQTIDYKLAMRLACRPLLI